MKNVEEYVRMAEQAQEDGAHVAVLMHYRNAIELTRMCATDTACNYRVDAEPILLAAVEYAQRLKKDRDKRAVVLWGQETAGKIIPGGLCERIGQELVKLRNGGEKDAGTS